MRFGGRARHSVRAAVAAEGNEAYLRRARSDAPYLLIQILDRAHGRLWGHIHCSNEYCAAFNHKIGGLDIAEETGGGFEDNRAGALDVGDKFAADFRAAQFQRFIPSKMGFERDNQASGGNCAFDGGGGKNFQGALGGELANEAAFDDCIGYTRIGVEEIAFFFDDQSAKGAKILRNRVRDGVIAQIHMATTFLAHGGSGGERDFQLRAALKATHLLSLDARFLGLGRGGFYLGIEPEMGAALFADSRIRAGRLKLFVTALGAGDRNFFLLGPADRTIQRK